MKKYTGLVLIHPTLGCKTLFLFRRHMPRLIADCCQDKKDGRLARQRKS